MITFKDEKELQKYIDKELEKRLSNYPILEFDKDGVPKIDPEKFLKGESLNSNCLVITFFKEVIEKLKDNDIIELYHILGGENPLEIYRFKDSNTLIAHEGVGCPACAGDLECLYALGINKVMFCGGGGVLDKSIGVGMLLVVEGAIRDEGFSFQYLEPSRVVYTDSKITNLITSYLDNHDIPYIKGLTWTTDAMFRETENRIIKRKSEGAKIVEMEQAGCIAISKYKNFDYGALIYGGDDVSGQEWDTRGWGSREGFRYDLVLICKEIVEKM